MSNLSERKSGITTTSEEVRPVLKAETFGQLNDVYTDAVAKVMLGAWKLEKSESPQATAFIKGTAEKKKSGFREIFFQIAKKQNMGRVDEAAVDGAWSKVMKNAEARFKELRKEAELQRLQETAPPLPEQKPPVTPAEEELVEITEGIEIIPDELPYSLKAERWTTWRATPLNNDTIGKLNYEFGHALARELPRLSDEQVQEVRKLYESLVGDMYETTYPGDRERIERALESYWRMLLESTRLIAPVEQPSK